jgi:hypothetical protein
MAACLVCVHKISFINLKISFLHSLLQQHNIFQHLGHSKFRLETGLSKLIFFIVEIRHSFMDILAESLLHLLTSSTYSSVLFLFNFFFFLFFLIFKIQKKVHKNKMPEPIMEDHPEEGEAAAANTTAVTNKNEGKTP